MGVFEFRVTTYELQHDAPGYSHAASLLSPAIVLCTIWTSPMYLVNVKPFMTSATHQFGKGTARDTA